MEFIHLVTPAISRISSPFLSFTRHKSKYVSRHVGQVKANISRTMLRLRSNLSKLNEIGGEVTATMVRH